MLTVQVASQTVSSNRSRFVFITWSFLFMLRNEYFLTDYLVKIGNFDQFYIGSALNTELYFDDANMSYKDLAANKDNILQYRRNSFGVVKNDKILYDFSIIPLFGFLGSSTPLVKNVELKLSFDRAPGNVSIIKWDAAKAKSLEKPFAIDNCHAITEYISSPELRSYFDGIDNNPIVYQYEESEVIIRTLEKNDKNLRIDAIKGGNLPSFIFAGIIPQENLTGSIDFCSTEFNQHDVISFNITVDGQSVNGYPIETRNYTRIFPLSKFLDTTNSLVNVNTGCTISNTSFKHNYIWSHKFEVERSSTGWIGIDIKLENAYKDNMSLVVWLISPCALTIDKYNEIEFQKL